MTKTEASVNQFSQVCERKILIRVKKEMSKKEKGKWKLAREKA